MSTSRERWVLAGPAAAAVNGLTRTIVGARLVNGALTAGAPDVAPAQGAANPSAADRWRSARGSATSERPWMSCPSPLPVLLAVSAGPALVSPQHLLEPVAQLVLMIRPRQPRQIELGASGNSA